MLKRKPRLHLPRSAPNPLIFARALARLSRMLTRETGQTAPQSRFHSTPNAATTEPAQR